MAAPGGSIQRRSVEADVGIEQAVERLGAARQLDEVALQSLGEGVEETPDVPRLERLVARFAPLMQDPRDQLVRANSDIGGTDHEIVRDVIFDLGQFVDREARVLMMPAVHEFADGRLHEPRQVTVDVCGVLLSEFHPTGKADVVADEDAGAGRDARGERLVVRVPQPEAQQ